MQPDYTSWLNHITTPYLPVLGAVAPNMIIHSVLKDVIASLESGDRPEYDKGTRWSPTHQERLIDISQTAMSTRITTTINCKIRMYAYGKRTLDSPALYTDLFEFDSPSQSAHCTNVYLFRFTGGLQAQEAFMPTVIVSSHDSKYIDGIADLDDSADMAGFKHAATVLRSGEVGPIIVVVENGMVIGAIGPLDIKPDAHGISMLLPPYFGAVGEVRGRGIGRILWDAARQWAGENQANYLVLQAEDGVAADQFYRRNGFEYIGSVYRSRKA
ncbi:GNAT family N-acetyltransferase [Candidatus Saccharibacteria bacterium]|nr:GNAT family N-acetyltransferase [Candidatus Saccharibacteria bacterium]